MASELPSGGAAGGVPPVVAGTVPTAGMPDDRHQHRRQHRRRRRRRAAVTVLGATLLWGGLGLAGYVYGWQAHVRAARTALVGRERSVVRHVAEHHGTAPCVVSAPQPGQLAGILSIPALGLTAPVEEGTTDATLAVAVGHDGTSVWPGTAGTSVLLAHDVSYFVHLDQLQAGDRIVYRTACTTSTFSVSGQQVVQQGTPVPGSTTPTLVLDTCYPPDALFFTTKRLLVSATETTDGPAGTAPAGSAGVTDPAQEAPSYSVPAPPALVAQGLTLQQNEAPMGTMTLAGDTSPSWEQSPGPLALEAAALEAYFGGIDSAEQGQTGWWSAIAEPGVPPPEPLRGGTIAGHTAPLDVTITSTGGSPSSVVLATTVTVAGGAGPGTYDESVTEPVHGTTVLLGGWSMTPA